MSACLALRRTDPPGLPRLFSLATRARLVTQWPHAGMVVDNELMHATLSDGLHATEFDPHGWDLLALPDSMDPLIRARFLERKGAQYDALSLLAFVLPWRISDSRRVYCYEWCWQAMTGANPNWRVTPEQLLWCAHELNNIHHRTAHG